MSKGTLNIPRMSICLLGNGGSGLVEWVLEPLILEDLNCPRVVILLVGLRVTLGHSVAET